MSTTLTIPSLQALVQWTFEETHPWSNSTNSGTFQYRPSGGLTNGTGSGKASVLYVSETTLAGGASINLDLNGSLTDLFSNVVSFTRIKAIYLEHRTDTTSTAIVLGGAGSSPFISWLADVSTGKIRVRNGGCFFLGCTDSTGYVVANGVSDQLLLTNEDSVNTATYRLALVGE